MKKFITCLFVAGLALSVSALTYDEGFDTAGNWSGSYGSYAGTAYYEDASGTGSFEGTTSLREAGTATQGGSAYAWRLDDIAGDYWRYQVNEGVVSFSVYTADWDVSDGNTFKIRYSTDSGSGYTDLLATNASYYSGDRVYKQFESGVLNITPDAGEEIYLEVYNEGGDERILVDTFSVTTIPEPMLLGILPLAFLFFRRK